MTPPVPRPSPAAGSAAGSTTTRPERTVVAALGVNRAIGREGRLLWQLPGDLPRFRALTMGGVLLMGRATFDSIGRPLPGRQTVVLTRDRTWRHDGVQVAHDVASALALAESLGPQVFLIGGGNVWEQTIEDADVLELTEVDDAPPADTFFPIVSPAAWREVSRVPGPVSDGAPRFDYVRYERAVRR